ncbi:MAG: hypothetical protein RQ806_06500 [Erythrobacter sp.]|nr:hypothetical protein [Erythrobacter sp.]
MAGLSGRTVALGNPPSSDHQINQSDLADWMTEFEARAGQVFETLPDFYAVVASGLSVPQGTLVIAGGVAFEAHAASSHLRNLAGWREFGPYTPEHQGAVSGEADSAPALAAFFANIAGRNARINKTFNVPNRANMVFVCNGGDFTLDMTGGTIDASATGLSGTRRTMIRLAGSEGPSNPVQGFTEVTDDTGKVSVTVQVAGHGLSAGDDIFLASDDVYDVGYDTVNEKRGQHARVASVVDADHFTIYQPLWDPLVTNPTMKRITFLENVTITNATISGPGRRAVGAIGGDEGDTGFSFLWARDCHLIRPKVSFFDYNQIRFDNCVGCTVVDMEGTLDLKNGSEAFAAHVLFINACEQCHVVRGTTFGGKHPFDFSRNPAPGIGRNCTVSGMFASGCWAGIATHGNSVDCRMTDNKITNSLYGINPRAPGWTIVGTHGEHLSEVVRLTGNPRDIVVDRTSGTDVNYVVRLPSSVPLIGLTETSNLRITNTTGLRVKSNAVHINPAVPYFTQADAAVLAGSTTTKIVIGPLGGIWDVDRALQGAQIDIDVDGGGSGSTVSRFVTSHNWTGTQNELTFTGISVAPIAGLATYTLYDATTLRNLVVDGVSVSDCLFAPVYVKGPWKGGYIDNVSASAEVPRPQPVVWLDSVANLRASNFKIGQNIVNDGYGDILVTDPNSDALQFDLAKMPSIAGLPIVERGNNANGDYVRFADGTQVCSITRSVSLSTSVNGAVFTDVASFGAWVFPASFSEAPNVFANAVATADQWAQAGARSSSQVAAIVVHSTKNLASVARTISVTAIGRWF